MNATAKWNHFWFAKVPSYRLAFFRMAIALTTLKFFLKYSQTFIYYTAASAFNNPMLPGIPELGILPGKILLGTQYAAAAALFFGCFPQIAAGFLALSGLYVFLLDQQCYSHWFQFHLILLTLLSFSKENFPIFRWLRRDRNSDLCPVWPEHLIRFQLSIVFFYTAVSKVFSPHWGLNGEFFKHVLGTAILLSSNPWIAACQKTAVSFVLEHPSAASLIVICVEFFIAGAFLCRPLWRAAVIITFLFAVTLQVLISPVAFAWDILAVLILFI